MNLIMKLNGMIGLLIGELIKIREFIFLDLKKINKLRFLMLILFVLK